MSPYSQKNICRKREWSWSGAAVRGTSHQKFGIPKQDAAAVAEYSSNEGSTLVIVVCDGAGSAAHSDVGSRVACRRAHLLIKTHLEEGKAVSMVDKAIAQAWLSAIRSKLKEKSEGLGVPLKELATTISIVIVGNDTLAAIIVGDSPCVIHDGGEWAAPIWPMKGEYANQTHFVTQDSMYIWECAIIKKKIDQLAVFTDGIDKLVLLERERRVFQPFFDGVFKENLWVGSLGRNRILSDEISRFLSSERINKLTDDDKTLVLAKRFSQ